MKKTLFVIAFAIGLVATGCKDKETTDKKNDVVITGVPSPVSAAFTAKYGGVSAVKWESSNEDGMKTYKAKFNKDGVEWKVEYGEDGRVIKEKMDD